MRRMLLLCAALLCVSGVAGAAESAAGNRPNFLYLLIDDLGWSDVGFNGGSYKTPQIDKLASEGVRLAQHYVQPVCSPTRAALLTGRYPMRHGLQTGVVRPWAQHGLPLEERTLAQALKEAGYFTAICGKWHVGLFEPAYLPTRRGFDHQYGHYTGMIDCFTHVRDGGFDWHRNDKVCRDEGYSTQLVAKETIRLIEEHGGKKPLFLYVPFNAVHAPIQAPPQYLAKFANLPKGKQAYAAMLLALDDSIGQIVEALERKGIRQNTLIVFSSDNGGPRPGSNGSFRGYKGGLYEGGVRVAAFVNWPGILKGGGVVDQPIHMVDWYPTLVKLAGGSLDQKLPLDGRDIWPTIAQGKPTPHEFILLNTEPDRGAIRVGDWKLMVSGSEGEGDNAAPRKAKRRQAAGIELYDLKADPGEKNDLAAKMPEKVKELKARYEELAKQAAHPKDRDKPAAGFKAPAIWGEM